jgi:hypothetical protein
VLELSQAHPEKAEFFRAETFRGVKTYQLAVRRQGYWQRLELTQVIRNEVCSQ